MVVEINEQKDIEQFVFDLRDKYLKQMNETDSRAAASHCAAKVTVLDEVYSWLIRRESK